MCFRAVNFAHVQGQPSYHTLHQQVRLCLEQSCLNQEDTSRDNVCDYSHASLQCELCLGATSPPRTTQALQYKERPHQQVLLNDRDVLFNNQA
jgi:hypothetical protein